MKYWSSNQSIQFSEASTAILSISHYKTFLLLETRTVYRWKVYWEKTNSVHSHFRGDAKLITTTLNKTCWDKSWKSSKFKKYFNFLNSQFSPLPSYINVESGQVLLSKAQNFANNIDLEGEGFFSLKNIFSILSQQFCPRL